MRSFGFMLPALAVAGVAACGGVTVSDDDSEPPECEDGATELLVNPGFEEATQTGAVGWTEEAAEGDHLTFPEEQLNGFSVHEGERAAWLGRATPADQRLRQTVAVPAGNESLVLAFFKCFVTEESEPAIFDTLEVSILDADGDLVEVLASYTNLDADDGCEWELEEFDVEDPLPGEEIAVEFHAETDNGSLTSFFVDTVSLEATGSCPDGG